MKLSIKAIVFFNVLFISSLFLSAQNAKDIFLNATKQLVSKNLEIGMRINSTDKKGRVKKKEFVVLLAKLGEIEKMKVSWEKPERAKGITVIITTPPNDIGVIEVYTPSNGKVRKLKATEENMNMVGSEFSLMNMDMGKEENLTFNYLGQEKIEGKICHIIEAKDKEKKGQSKGVFFIEENTFQILQINIFDNKGKQTTEVNMSDYEPIANLHNKIHPKHIVSKDLKKQKRTDIEVMRINYQSDIKEADFSLPEQNK